MKILVGYSSYPHKRDIALWNEQWLERLRRRGFDVEGVCLTLEAPAPRLRWPELDRMWRTRDRRLMAHYDSLLERLQGVDALLNYNGINLHPEFVEQLPCVTVYSCADDPESSEDLSKPVASSYDLCMVGNIASVGDYRDWGCKDVRFWPLGFRHGDFDPGLDEHAITSRTRDVPLALLCERESHWRKERLDRFTEAFPEGVFRGRGWPLGFLPEEERVPLLQRTKVGINFHNSTGPINFRTYYLPANGVLQVCDNRSNLARLYEIGKEAAGFDTVEEAIDLCRYFIEHDEERIEIAVAGWKRAMKDYSEEAVFRRLVDALEDRERTTKQPISHPVRIPSEAACRFHLHHDHLYQPDQWHHRFRQQLVDVHRLDVVDVDLLAPDALRRLEGVGENDALIGRFGHLPADLSVIRPIHGRLSSMFGGRIFPSLASYGLYDDKRSQAKFFRERCVPTPFTEWIENPDDLAAFLRGTGLRFPLVMKTSGGAGSTGVSLVRAIHDVRYPCLLQRFCEGNDGDLRLNVIGDRVMGFRRRNRPGDFRASGSGILEYPDELPTEAVELAWKISKDAGFESMAYDFVRMDGRWQVLEMSYAYVDTAVRDCAYCYDMSGGGKLDKRGVYPQDFIVRDFLDKYYPGRACGKASVSLTGHASGSKREIEERRASPRILVVADVPGWIFERHAKTLQKELSDEFDIRIAYQGEEIDEDAFDLLFPLEWNLVDHGRIHHPEKWVTGIRSHVSWENVDPVHLGTILRDKFLAVHAVSKRLCAAIGVHRRDVALLAHGVRIDHFMSASEPFASPGRVAIGWAGNRKSPVKGFEQFIAPLGSLPGVEVCFCGYSDRLMNFDEMKEFYEGIDVYVCSSLSEGHNNSLLEAAAMGRAIVTTDVGTVPEYLEDGVSALIVERTPQAFRNAVERLLADPELGRRLGRNAMKAVERFSWSKKIAEHRSWLRTCLEKSKTEFRGGKKDAGHAIRFQSPEDVVVYAGKMIGEGQYSLAVGMLRNLLEIVERPDAMNLLGRALMASGDFNHAQSTFLNATMLWPNDPEGHSNLAAVLIARGQAERAEQSLEKVLELDPGDQDAMFSLGRARLLRGQTQGAQLLHRLAAGNAGRYAMESRILLLLAGHEAPRRSATRSNLGTTPEGWLDALDAGERTMRKGRHEEALERLRACQKAKGDDPELLAAIGICLLRLGDEASARSSFAKALEFLPDSGSLRELVGSLPKLDRESVAGGLERKEMVVARTDAGDSDGAIVGDPESWNPSFSFCLITNGERLRKLTRTIRTIRAQGKRVAEIMVAGILPPGFSEPGVEFISMPDAAKNGRLGEMRNAMVERAVGDVLVVCDDDFVFDGDFCRELAERGPGFDVLCARIRNPDGSRFWDWASAGAKGQRLLPYGEDDPDVYVTGGLCIARPHVFSRCRWNADLGFYQSEDLDFSRRLKAEGMRIESCPSAQVMHDDHRYSQFDAHVVRVDMVRKSVGELVADHPAREARLDLSKRLLRFVADLHADRPSRLEELAGLSDEVGFDEIAGAIRERIESLADAGAAFAVFLGAGEEDPISRYFALILPFLDGHSILLTGMDRSAIPVSDPVNQRIMARPARRSRVLATLASPDDWKSVLAAAQRANPGCREIAFLCAKTSPVGFPTSFDGVSTRWVVPGERRWERGVDQVLADPRALDEQAESLASFLFEPKKRAPDELDGRVQWAAPLLNYSGYARLNRDLVRGLHDAGIDPGILPLDTDREFLATIGDHSAEGVFWRAALGRPRGEGTLVCSHLPSSFPSIRQGCGRHRRHVGLTMFETDRLPRGWAEACNEMDEIWVPSTFNLDTFSSAGVDRHRLKVIPCGIDLDRWDPATPPMTIPGARSFVFLAVFEWTLRKGWDVLVEAFARAFGPDDDVCLVLRARRPGNDATPIRTQIDRHLRSRGCDPEKTAPIILLEEPLPDSSMPSLYARADVVVLPTRGEGWGLPFMEAMAMERPVVATEWGAHLDFVDDSVGWLVPIDGLEAVPRQQSDLFPLYESDHRWARPSMQALADTMRRLPSARDEIVEKGVAGRLRLAKEWSPERSAAWVRSRLDALNGGTERGADGTSSCKEPGVLVKAGFFDFSGYSRLARDAALSLREQGARIGIQAFLQERRFLEGLADSPERLESYRTLVRDDGAKDVAVAWFPPTVWHGKHVYERFREEHPECRKFVAMTMFETDRLPKEWACRCNEMDEIWVPTSFNVETFAQAGVDRHRLKVIPFGLRMEEYDPDRIAPMELGAGDDHVFLSVFQWSWRKGWDLLLEAFAREFSPDEKVKLVLRTYPLGDPEPPIRSRIDAFLAAKGLGAMSGRVQLVEEFVSDDRMPSLINACDCFVLPTRGEGWGIPFMEAMALSKPVIATRWSGHLDFMDDANSFLVDIEGLEPVQEQMRQDSELYESDHQWARPSLDHLRRRMREVFSDPERAKAVGAIARESVLNSRDSGRTARWIRERCRELSAVAVKRAPGVVAVDARCLFDADTRDRGIGHYTNEHLLALERNDPGLRFLFLAPEGADPRLVDEHLACGRVELVPFSRFRPGSADHFHIPDPLGDCEGRISPFHVGFRGPRSTVFYDLIPRKFYLEHWPKEMRAAYLRRLEQAIRFEGAHLCISHSTRSDLVAEGFADDRALWIGAGLNRASSTSPMHGKEAAALLARLGIRGPFFLQVGALDAHKNFDGSLSCFLATRAKTPCQLVVVGRRVHSIAWWEQYCRSKGIPDVVFTDFLPRRDLEVLYARAIALLFLSRIEGFGFPVLEAMAQGCPVIAYANSSLPEVGGDAACLVRDGDEAAVVNVMHRLLADPEEHARRKRAGIERAAKFSWDDVARRTLDAWGRTADVRGDRRVVAVGPSTPVEARPTGVKGNAPAQVVWAAPVFDPSGYGDEARGFLRCLDAQGEAIAVRSIGRTSERFRDGMEERDRARFDRLSALPAPAGATLVVSFPAHGYRRFAEYGRHVGRTMFETDSLPPSWVEACDSMDEIWVPTDFNLETFRRAGVRKPILKIPGGVDAKAFRPGLEPLALPGPSRGTTYLSVFEWTRRKAPDVLLAGWARAFAREDDVRLVLRAYPPNGIEGDPESWVESMIAEELARIGMKREDCAPIVVLAAQIPDRDMPRLYAAADVYLAPSRGEGWGRPHMEAMSCGVPVIATRWSGNLEFQDDDNSWLIDVDGVVPVEGMEFDFYRGMRWAEPSLDSFVSLIRASRADAAERTRKGERARKDVETRWDWTVSSRLVATRLAEIRRGVPATESALGGRAPLGAAESAKPTASRAPAGAPGSSRLSGALEKVAEGLRMRGGREHSASPVPKADAAAASAQDVPCLSIRWEGSQFVHHSLAHVNRELCAGLAKHGHDLSIIPYEPDQFGPGDDPDLGIIAQLTNAPLDEPCQIHVRHQWPPNLVAPKEGRWVVVQPWEFGSPPKDWMPAFREKVDEIWAYTRYVRDMYVRAGVPEDRVHVVPLGVDCDRFRPGLAPLASLPPKKGVRFLYVGGSIARKGFDVLLNAWQKAFGPDDPVELLIKDMGGKASYKGQTGERFVRQIQESGRFATIHYLDDDLAPSDLPALYASGDVLVHPYRGEGFGLPIAEAMACGLPVVITAGGAADDFCGEGEAWTIPSRKVFLPGGKVDQMETVEPPWWLEPSEEALIAVLREAAANEGLRREKGARARQRIAEGFTWTHAVERAEARLRALAARPLRRGDRFAAVDASLEALRSQGSGAAYAAAEAQLEDMSQRLLEIEALLARQAFEEAEVLASGLTEDHPDRYMAWVTRAIVYRGMKKASKALEALKKAGEVGGGPEVHYETMALLLQTGKEGPARVQWNILREKYPVWVERQRALHREQGMPWLPDRFKPAAKARPVKSGRR